jgi:aspartyl-tRNA(Asn)/glutamyl-tRNA(Gln) amidotransferase subunit C
MAIEIDIAHVARLARLGIPEEELAAYGEQLEVILEHAAAVQGADTEGVEPTAHPLGITNAFRQDEVRPSLDRAAVLAQGPDTTDEYFRVPPAMGAE